MNSQVTVESVVAILTFLEPRLDQAREQLGVRPTGEETDELAGVILSAKTVAKQAEPLRRLVAMDRCRSLWYTAGELTSASAYHSNQS